LNSIHEEYEKIISDAEQFDGAMQAAFLEAAQSNYAKAVETINILLKLTRFIVNSSDRVRQEDQRIAYKVIGGVG